MLNKKIIFTAFLLFGLLFIIKDINAATAAPITRFGGVPNSTLSVNIPTSLSGTVIVQLDMASSFSNSTVDIFNNQSGVNTWTRTTLAGISGNTTCYANSSCRRGAGSGDLRVTLTLPGEAAGIHFRSRVNGTTQTNGANTTYKFSIDRTGPIFNLYPNQSAVIRSVNRTMNLTILTTENASSMWVILEGVNYSRIHGTNGVNGLSVSGVDKTWKLSAASYSDGLHSYYARAYDYAINTSNGATSAVRTFQISSGTKPLTQEQLTFIQSQQAATNLKPLLILGIIIFAVYLYNKRGK